MSARVIDIHTHGLGRYDTRSGRAEHILRMAGLHGKAGTDAIVPTVYSGSIPKMRSDLEAIARAMDAGHEKGSAKIIGAHLEGPFLNPARAGALERKSFIPPTLGNLKKLLSGYERVVRIITLSPELKGALRVIERAAGMDIVVSMGHSDATHAQAVSAANAGASSITHLFNAMAPLHHREPGLAGFALMDKDIYVEVIADGIHVHPEVLRMVFELKKPERIIAVSDSVSGPMRKGGLLQGGGAPLGPAQDILRSIGVPVRSIQMALGGNAANLLGL